MHVLLNPVIETINERLNIEPIFVWCQFHHEKSYCFGFYFRFKRQNCLYRWLLFLFLV